MPLDPQQLQRQLVVRTWQVVGVAALAFLAVVSGYAYTQVVRGSYYRELADNNRLRELPIQAPRGLIVDRAERPLVENVPSYQLLLDRSRSGDLDGTVRFLARVLEETPQDLAARLATYDRVPSFQPVLIAEDLTLAQVAAVEATSLEHPELEVEVAQRRFYRHGTQTAHVVGYLGEASEEQLARRPGLAPGDRVGVKGVEQTFDSLLRGHDGRRVVVVDSRGKLVREQLREPGVAGQDVELTLDLDLQQEAERFFEDKVGSAVAMDPRTGEILVMVSSPSFNPNAFARRLDSREWRAIVSDEHHPLQNRSIQNAYPPGSVFKIVTAIAALEEGVVGTEETLFCGGATRIYNHRFRCWKRGGHGSVNLREALQHSCDVFFYHLGPRLKIDRLAEWAKHLGLGVRTGIDLQGEKPGLVPDPEWSLRVRKSLWFPGETISVVIGQGPLLVTPLQVAVMLSAVANGGRLVKPYIVKGNSQGPPESLDLEPSTLEIVRDALVAVVNEPGGTGSAARMSSITVAGKTGTAQVIRQTEEVASDSLPYRFRDHAWFASFAPAQAPELVVVVFVEHGGHGSSAAAPLARIIYERHFKSSGGDLDT